MKRYEDSGLSYTPSESALTLLYRLLESCMCVCLHFLKLTLILLWLSIIISAICRNCVMTFRLQKYIAFYFHPQVPWSPNISFMKFPVLTYFWPTKKKDDDRFSKCYFSKVSCPFMWVK